MSFRGGGRGFGGGRGGRGGGRGGFGGGRGGFNRSFDQGPPEQVTLHFQALIKQSFNSQLF